jgi:hypothetical protein
MILLLKVTLVPIFIAAIAIIGRKYGAKMAGLLSGFPVIAAPLLFFIYFDQGAGFAFKAANSTLAGVISLASFCYVYAWLATRFSWFLSWLLSMLVYFLIVTLLVMITRFQLSIHLYYIVTLILIFIYYRYSPVVTPLNPFPENNDITAASNFEIAIRMSLAVLLVLLVTYSANWLGENFSGIFAVFPIAASVIAVFSHKNHGVNYALISLKAMQLGLISLLSFFYLLVILLHILSFEWAFFAAACVSILSPVILNRGRAAFLNCSRLKLYY